MRLARLDLARYGRFTDRTLDFGPKPDGASDFHIVYGLNEAGKSTAVSAILDLLFGIEVQTQYGAGKGRSGAANWHPYSALKIGARLETGGGVIELARLKRDKNSLVDAESRPLDEAFLKTALRGVDRAAFRTMFSLDEESLEKGGEAILASRGDLGQLLFSASAGLAELGGRLGALREEAERFYKPRAHKTTLAEKKRELDALKAQREALDLQASAYAELVRQRDEAQADYESSTRALAERRARAKALKARLDALPHLAALRDVEAALAPLADLPATPEGWSAEIAKLEAEAIRLEAERDHAERDIAAREAELERLGEDAAALAAAAQVEGWGVLRGRYVTAADIPVRQGERETKQAAVGEILRRLGREGETDPRRLLLTTGEVATLEDLIAARSGVESKLDLAKRTASEAKAAFDAALAEAPQGEDAGAAIDALQRELQRARRDDPTQRLTTMREEREKLGRRIQAAMAALQPWRGAPEELADVVVPGEAETETLRNRLLRAKADRDDCRRRLADKAAERARLAAEDAAAARADIVTDAEAAAIRAARDAAWRVHRASLDTATADAFAASMRRDDEASEIRLAHAHELAAARERTIKRAGLAADEARARADLEAAEQALAAIAAEIASALPAAAPAGRDALAFLDAWRARRDEALTLIARLDEMKAEAIRVDAQETRVRGALAAGLRTAAIPFDAEAGVERLIDAAEAAVAAHGKAEGLRRAVKDRRLDLARAEGRLKSAAEEDLGWRDDWREAVSATWLGEGGSPTLAAVRGALGLFGDLREALNDCDALDHRIESMQRDRRAFVEAVADAARVLGLDADGDPLVVADAAEARVAKARETLRRRAEALVALQNARRGLEDVADRLALNARLGAAMREKFSVATLADVADRLDACRRRDEWSAAATKARKALLDLAVADDLAATRAAVEACGRAALDAELAELEARHDDDNKSHAETYARFDAARRKLEGVGGDDAVARIEEQRRTILEEIKDGAQRYLRLRAGVAAAEAALSLYRERHRGAMMDRASHAFREISRGTYKGLVAEPDGDSEKLFALGADGGSKTAGELSRGARFQLYLALRVAGYHELARSGPPAPFVADDIMETFDHFRAEEALRLFADMGRVGQVIYFTHHLHLAEIAKRVCPEARLHELAA